MHTGTFFNVIVDERLGLQHRLYHLRGPHRGKCARTHVCSSALENQEQNAKQIRNIPADSCLVSWTKSAGPGKPCCEVESQQAHQNNYIKKCHAKKMLTCRHRLCLCPCAPRVRLFINTNVLNNAQSVPRLDTQSWGYHERGERWFAHELCERVCSQDHWECSESLVGPIQGHGCNGGDRLELRANQRLLLRAACATTPTACQHSCPRPIPCTANAGTAGFPASVKQTQA